MVPKHAPDVRNVSGQGHAGYTAATKADFNSRGRNTAQDSGNMAPLVWLS